MESRLSRYSHLRPSSAATQLGRRGVGRLRDNSLLYHSSGFVRCRIVLGQALADGENAIHDDRIYTFLYLTL